MSDENSVREFEPERIDVSAKIFAIKITTSWFLKIPYNEDVVDIMRMTSGSNYDGNGFWRLPVRYEDAVRPLLERVSDILEEKGVDIGERYVDPEIETVPEAEPETVPEF